MELFLPRDLVVIASRMAQYPYPNLKKLVLSDNLYMQAFLKNDNAIVERFVLRIVEIVERELNYDEDEDEADEDEEDDPDESDDETESDDECEKSGPNYLLEVLDILWAYPGDYTIKARSDDYRRFYTALVNDDIDMSRLPSPDCSDK